jgi:hypothetical protein
MFFEPPEPPPEAPLTPPQPPWAGPPDDELGAPVAVRLVLARTGEVAIAITELVAFTNGFEVLLSTRRREQRQGPARRPYGGGPMAGPDDPAALRFGVQFADGRKATSQAFGLSSAARRYFMAAQQGRTPEPPPGPIIHPRGGGGGGGRYDFRYFVWPLPSPGRLVLACEWPAEGVPETLQEIDAGEILSRAADSTRLWE